MQKVKYALFLVLFSFGMTSYAQEDKGPGFIDKVFVGGGFGAGFGNYTFINVSPIIGYRVTPRLSTGIRLMYQYTTYDYYFGGDKLKFKGNDYGAGLFARFLVRGPFFLQAEYEYLNYEDIYFDGSSIRSSFDSFMAGGGISQPIGGKAFFFLTALYNFSYNNISSVNKYRVPYDSPWVIRMGVTAGF
jgi:hypothetical protein